MSEKKCWKIYFFSGIGPKNVGLFRRNVGKLAEMCHYLAILGLNQPILGGYCAKMGYFTESGSIILDYPQ